MDIKYWFKLKLFDYVRRKSLWSAIKLAQHKKLVFCETILQLSGQKYLIATDQSESSIPKKKPCNENRESKKPRIAGCWIAKFHRQWWIWCGQKWEKLRLLFMSNRSVCWCMWNRVTWGIWFSIVRMKTITALLRHTPSAFAWLFIAVWQ